MVASSPIGQVQLYPPQTVHHKQGFTWLLGSTKTIAESEHPILVVNFLPFGDRSSATPPRQRDAASLEMFRAIPATIQSIENNLSIGNMGFEEFAESVEADGVFRGDV